MSFVLVHKHLKGARKKQAKYADRKAKDIQFEVGDPVYYKVHNKKSKLNLNRKPYYCILEKTSPVTYKIKHQLDGSVIKVHAENIRKAHVDEWQTPNVGEGRQLRKTNYVIPPDSDESSSNSENSEDDMLLARFAQSYRNKRNDSEDEGPIPKMELAKYSRLQE